MKILFIVAHPDDEVIGCGGTIAYHVKKDDVRVIFTNGTGSRNKDKLINSKNSYIRKKVIF